MKYIRKILLFGICFLFIGCMGKKDVVEEFESKVNDTKGYHISGELEIYNSEDKYTYSVDVAYSEPNNFKVSLINIINNHEQIILRNSEGVYVLTPSLNKSFKFQSEWPFNSSQIYLLQTILEDLNNDDDKVIEEVDDGFAVTSKVNFTNNSYLVKQVIYFDKDNNIKEIQIFNEDDSLEMRMVFNTVDYNSSYDESYFKIDNYMSSEVTESSSSEIENIIYPMYLPLNTSLTNQQKVSLDVGERVILTFEGDSPFTVIQETTSISDETMVIPTMGEIDFITGTIGTIENNSVSWSSSGLDFYITSDTLSNEELLKIANSTNYLSVGK